MAYDNNYGFKTVKDNLDDSLNGKWPIFGFDVNDIKTAFRTTRIVDSSNHSFPNTGNTKPNYNYGVNLKQGMIKELITSYDHGYDFRPMGWYTITGTFSLKCKAQVAQTAAGPGGPSAGGNYTVDSTYYINQSNAPESLPPSFCSMDRYSPRPVTPTPSPNYPLSTTIGTSGSNAKLIVPPQYMFPSNYSGNEYSAYISVEIDDKKVYIYMNYAYYDSWATLWDDEGPQVGDLGSRVRMVADTSGSIYNVNVFLAPYSIEEMLPDEQ